MYHKCASHQDRALVTASDRSTSVTPLSLHGLARAQPALQVAFAVEAAAAAAVAAIRLPPAALAVHAPATPQADPAAPPPRDFLLLQPSGRLVRATLPRGWGSASK